MKTFKSVKCSHNITDMHYALRSLVVDDTSQMAPVSIVGTKELKED